MKSPLWIINSTLTVIFLGVLIFILFSLPSIIERPPLAPLEGALKHAPLKRDGQKQPDTRFIHEEHDLFGTYRPAILPEKVVEQLPMIPQPPAPKIIMPPQRPPVHFLEPLPITINGIIASSNEARSQVTILNNTTKKTESYSVGDKLFDAYLIRIFPKKIIIIRSNGQQETLFMYPADAQRELENLKDVSWDTIVQRQSELIYLVNPKTFAQRISSLAQFIDMLDITTALKNDKTLGIRIGTIDQKSIGVALGFAPGDTIIKINDIAPLSTNSRMDLYDTITGLSVGNIIKVHIIRKNQIIVHEYLLDTLGYQKPAPSTATPVEETQPDKKEPQVEAKKPAEKTTQAPAEAAAPVETATPTESAPDKETEKAATPEDTDETATPPGATTTATTDVTPETATATTKTEIPTTPTGAPTGAGSVATVTTTPSRRAEAPTAVSTETPEDEADSTTPPSTTTAESAKADTPEMSTDEEPETIAPAETAKQSATAKPSTQANTAVTEINQRDKEATKNFGSKQPLTTSLPKSP
ncbi:hypothetical protein H0X06_00700 [Candidatus Dependentiae bacterium]|nr:hypothetical protein [Candidatus Dependentiae bacterium]